MDQQSFFELQAIKNIVKRFFQSDFDEIKNELREIKQELAKVNARKDESDLLTTEELCEELKLSRPSVNKLVHEKKKIRPIQLLDQDLRFKRADVIDMINSSYKEQQ